MYIFGIDFGIADIFFVEAVIVLAFLIVQIILIFQSYRTSRELRRIVEQLRPQPAAALPAQESVTPPRERRYGTR